MEYWGFSARHITRLCLANRTFVPTDATGRPTRRRRGRRLNMKFSTRRAARHVEPVGAHRAFPRAPNAVRSWLRPQLALTKDATPSFQLLSFVPTDATGRPTRRQRGRRLKRKFSTRRAARRFEPKFSTRRAARRVEPVGAHLYETVQPHQLLVVKEQCGSLTPVGAEPGSVVTVVSEKRADVVYDATSDVMGNGTVLLGTSH